MARLFHPLLKVLAYASHRELATQIQYLKAENEILRSKLPKQVHVTPAERARLVKLGLKVGSAIRELITIVSPRTFTRWASGNKSARTKSTRKPGRPRTPEEIRELVIQIAREIGGGYTRILGELKKLGIHNVCRSTVRNILIENGFDLGPKRGEGSWDEFLKIHAKSLWACDFISKKIWTLGGLVDYYVLFFIHLETRQVIVSSCTAHPDAEWVAQQARNMLMETEDRGLQVTHLLHDWDTKFTNQFDTLIASSGATTHRVGPAKPNLNAYAERFVQSIQEECLDHFIVLGPKHMDYLVREYVEHYHHERPHQALENAPPLSLGPPGDGEVVCGERLGGLLKHFYRKAA